MSAVRVSFRIARSSDGVSLAATAAYSAASIAFASLSQRAIGR